MKICLDCSNACDNNASVCPRCGSNNIAYVSEKHCVYCKTRVAIGTIICPHCHRILPPESDDIMAAQYSSYTPTKENGVAAAGVASGEASQIQSENIRYVQPMGHFIEVDKPEAVKATTFEENASPTPVAESAQTKQATNANAIPEYDKQNPLFKIYDKAPDILPVTKVRSESEIETPDAASEQLQADIYGMGEISEEEGYNKTGVIETKAYKTQRLSREEAKPQSKLPRILIFLFGCIYTAVGLWTNYMVHDYGDVLGLEMAFAVFIKYRDVFPSVYPYILYGSSFLSRFESYGSYLPYYMDHAMMFSLFAGITMMISAVPKWVVATLHVVVLGCHIGGVWMMAYLFGWSCVGAGAYVFVIGSLAVAVLHILFVRKSVKKAKLFSIKN